MNIMATGRKGSVIVGAFFPKRIQTKDQHYIAEKIHLGHMMIKDLNFPKCRCCGDIQCVCDA